MVKSRLMHVFADESGDADQPGLEPYFAFLAVAFKDDGLVNVVQEVVRKLRREWKRKKEIKFGKLNDDQLEQLLVAVGDLDFKYSSCVFRKEDRKGQWLKKPYVYERVIGSVVEGLADYFREVEAEGNGPLHVHVTHDEHTDRRYLDILKAEFKKPLAKSGYPFVKAVRPGKIGFFRPAPVRGRSMRYYSL